MTDAISVLKNYKSHISIDYCMLTDSVLLFQAEQFGKGKSVKAILDECLSDEEWINMVSRTYQQEHKNSIRFNGEFLTS